MLFIVNFEDFRRFRARIDNDTSDNIFRHPTFWYETEEVLTLYATRGDYVTYCTRLDKSVIPDLEAFKLEYLSPSKSIELLEPLKSQNNINVKVTQE